MSEELAVYLYGTQVGTLRRSKRERQSKVIFEAHREGIDRFSAGSRILGHRLPLILNEHVLESDSTNFFGGILSEGEAIKKHARKLGVSSEDVFGLLEGNMMNMVGAVGIKSPSNYQEGYIRLGTSDLSLALSNPDESLIDMSGGSSLPGVQPKTTMLFRDGEWFRPVNGAPTSHIVKPGRSGSSSIPDENYVLRLGRELGLVTYDSEMIYSDNTHALVIERYDRKWEHDGTLSRIHQEDFNQALGVDWSILSDRFEGSDGKVSLRAIAAVLKRYVGIHNINNEDGDIANLLRYVTFNTVVANTDAHSKNFSILKLPDGGVKLAPLYDVNPTGSMFGGKTSNALYINGKSSHFDVTVYDLVGEGTSWDMDGYVASGIVSSTIKDILAAVDKHIPDSDVNPDLRGFIQSQANNLLRGHSTLFGITPVGIKKTPYKSGEVTSYALPVPSGKGISPSPTVKCHSFMKIAKAYCSLPYGHAGRHRQ